MEDKNVKNIENNEQVVEETTISVEPKKEGLFAKGKEFYNKNKGKVKAVAFTGLGLVVGITLGSLAKNGGDNDWDNTTDDIIDADYTEVGENENSTEE